MRIRVVDPAVPRGLELTKNYPSPKVDDAELRGQLYAKDIAVTAEKEERDEQAGSQKKNQTVNLQLLANVKRIFRQRQKVRFKKETQTFLENVFPELGDRAEELVIDQKMFSPPWISGYYTPMSFVETKSDYCWKDNYASP